MSSQDVEPTAMIMVLDFAFVMQASISQTINVLPVLPVHQVAQEIPMENVFVMPA